MEKKTELIFIPFPVPGHLLPTIELAKRLINHDRRIHTITILLWKIPFSPNAGAYARSLAAAHPNIRLIDMPEFQDPPPLEMFSTSAEAYIYECVEKTKPIARKTISDILTSSSGVDSNSVRVAALVLDLFCVHMIDIASDVGLPSYIFLTSNTGFLGVMQYLQKRHRSIGSKLEKNARDEEVLIPGFPDPVPIKFLPSGLLNQASYDAYVKISKRFADAKGILVNTFAELEPYALKYFSNGQNHPQVYPVGPVLNLKDRPNPNLNSNQQEEEIKKWLDDQPESSVVFLCFGGMGIFGAPQLIEIARGLELSGYRFIWSIRTHPLENKGPHDLLPEGFVERVAGRGMVCGWAPQVEILAHKAIGGFVSHCGWNSILESLWFGVIIAAWPLHAEQQLNAFKMVKELGLALEMRLDYVAAKSETVMADEIARALRCLMEVDNVLRKKVKDMAEAARTAVMDGGSSSVALENFIRVESEEELAAAVETALTEKKDCLRFIEVIARKDDTSEELLRFVRSIAAANDRPLTNDF